MQLFLGAVPIFLRLLSKARGHLLFSNYSRNNLPKPTDDASWLTYLASHSVYVHNKAVFPVIQVLDMKNLRSYLCNLPL